MFREIRFLVVFVFSFGKRFMSVWCVLGFVLGVGFVWKSGGRGDVGRKDLRLDLEVGLRWSYSVDFRGKKWGYLGISRKVKVKLSWKRLECKGKGWS